MEAAAAEFQSQIPQSKEIPKSPSESVLQTSEKKPDGKIARLIQKFKKASTPDGALVEIANYDPNAPEIAGSKPVSESLEKGMKDRIFGALGRLKNNADPDDVLSQIAQSAEISEDGESDAAREMVKNANIFGACVNKLREYGQYAKDNPYAMATILVPTALVALEKMVGIPLPSEMASLLPGAVGGGMSGVSMAPERYGTKGKVIGAVAGVGAGIGISKGLEQVASSGPVELVAGFVDDGASAIAKPVVSTARKFRKPL